MPEVMTRPCAVCGSSSSHRALSLGEWEVRACVCGVKRLWPEPSTVQMEEFEDGSGYASYEGLRDAIMAQHHRTLAGLERVAAPGALLDVGCGTGSFMQAADARGWKVTGVDPSSYSVEQTRALGFEAFHGLLEDQSFASASFDAIALLQVVEHVPDPRALLQACKRLLRRGGALLVATPNPDGLLARVRKQEWNYWIPPMHCTWYPPKALARLLEQNGFRVARRTTWSARAWGLHDGADIVGRTPLRRLPAKASGVVADLLAKGMDAAGYGTIVEQVGVAL